jgi:hypothetical protein
MYKNDSTKTLTHSAADAFQDRIDRIVIRLDMLSRNILSIIKEGTKSDNPIPPELERTDTVYEISLAQVRIIAGKSYIEQSQIVDERLDEQLCGFVSSLITIPTNDMWDDWLNEKTNISNEWNTWFNNAQNEYSQLDLNQFKNDLDSHTLDIENPHNVTPGQIGAETPTGAQLKANTAESNAKTYADNIASQAESNAKAYADSVASAAETNAKNYTDTHEAKSNPHDITPANIGAETPSGAQSKADTAENNAKAYTDTHEAKASPHSGHVKGTVSLTVSTAAPTSPQTNDIWIDISE